MNVPKMYGYLLILWVPLSIIGTSLISRSSKYANTNIDEEEFNVLIFEENEINVDMALRMARFWQIFFMLLFGSFFSLYVASVFKIVAKKYVSDSVLTMAGSVGAISNSGARIFWAALYDKYGFKIVYATILVIQFANSFTIFGFRKNESVYPWCVALSFFCEGAHFSIFPAMTVNIFGLKYGG